VSFWCLYLRDSVATLLRRVQICNDHGIANLLLDMPAKE